MVNGGQNRRNRKEVAREWLTGDKIKCGKKSKIKKNVRFRIEDRRRDE
jgi:hypothetical protein